MKDYNVQLKVRNNYLLQAMRRAGYESAAQLSRATGVQQATIGNYLNLQVPALTKRGQWRTGIETISETLSALPEDLFPPQHLESKLNGNVTEQTLSIEEVAEIQDQVQASPEELVEQQWDTERLHRIMDQALTDRERYVLTRRMGLDGDAPKTIEEVAHEMDRSRECPRQLEARALRKLRREHWWKDN